MINVGVVGCGYWGPKHVRNFHELPEAHMAIACDLDEQKLRQIRKLYPYLKTTTNFNELLNNEIDAVVIATPVNSHYKLTRQALLHDKHVLIEKPITCSSAEVLELTQLAESRNLILMVGHVYDYHPAVEFLQQLIKSGELGEIYGIDAHRLNLGLFRPDVNVIWDLGPHDIGIVLRLLDKEPVAVSAHGSGHIDPNLCDVAYLDLDFGNGTSAHIHLSWLDPRKVRQITIIGSKKMALYDDVPEEKIYLYDKGLAFSVENGGATAWPLRYRYGDVTIPFISNAEPLKLECGHFLNCIKDGKKARSDGWAALRVTSILEAANRSLLNHGQRESVLSVVSPIKTTTAVTL